ncbi:unnamed protein product [Penicillium salamii]|nr:unnamed protein product [Penicillium salamii]
MIQATNIKSVLRRLYLTPSRSLLDILLPEFSRIMGLLHRLLNRKGQSLTYVVYLLGILAIVRPHILSFTHWLQKYYTSTVYIQSSNETYDMLTYWISSRGLEDAARSFIAKVNTNRRSSENTPRPAKKAIGFSPYNGGFCFWYKKKPLFYRVNEDGVGYNKREEVSVTCLGRSSNILKDLLKDCRDEYLKSTNHKTTIFGHHGAQWKKDRTKEIRPLSTVILREHEKAPLIQDIREFLEPKTREWYNRRSLPYRRGYLLHGPPGTGKSSFSLSIAGELSMDIYTVSVPSVDDQSLSMLFRDLPENCVVLLEDIDAVGSVCPRDREEDDPLGESHPRGERKGVTLSGLLNVLDGIASQENRVLIMTTNHIEKLDKALIRPGRVDMRVEFPLADRDTIKEIYHYIFGPLMSTSSRNPSSVEGDSLVEIQATDFAQRLPKERLSPAQIVSYLLQHRYSPKDALENIEAWIKTM